MKALRNTVIIRTGGPRDPNKGLIHIPEWAKEKPQDGIVVAVGPEADKEIRIGDHVLFDKMAAKEMRLRERDYQIVADKDVVAKLELV